jgi:hypothetical protein
MNNRRQRNVTSVHLYLNCLGTIIMSDKAKKPLIKNAGMKLQRKAYSLALKRKIVLEAFGDEVEDCNMKHIFSTAKKYGVSPGQIRSWKASFEKYGKPSPVKPSKPSKLGDNDDDENQQNTSADATEAHTESNRIDDDHNYSKEVGNDFNGPKNFNYDCHKDLSKEDDDQKVKNKDDDAHNESNKIDDDDDQMNGIDGEALELDHLTEEEKYKRRLHQWKRLNSKTHTRLKGAGRRSSLSVETQKMLRQYFYKQRVEGHVVTLHKMREFLRIHDQQCYDDGMKAGVKGFDQRIRRLIDAWNKV